MTETESGGANNARADLLYGLQAIATHVQMTPRQVKHLVQTGALPAFKMGKTVCSTRSGLADHFAKQIERRAGDA